MGEYREPRVTLIELGLIAGSVAVLPFGGPLGFGFALGGSAVVARAIRRARRPRPALDKAARLRTLCEMRIPDAFTLAQIGEYVLVEAIDHARYRAVPMGTLADEEAVIATLCLHGTPGDVEQQLLPWRLVPHPFFGGFAGAGEVNGIGVVLFQQVTGLCLEDVVPLPRAHVKPLFATLFEALEACEQRGVVLPSLPAERIKLTGPTLMFAWKEPFDGRRCVVDPMYHVRDYSPEQVAGNLIGPQVMQFQLGMLLYLALTGRQPFGDGVDVLMSLMAMLSQPPQPLELGEPDLEQFVLKLLAKAPEERFSSLAEAREAFLKLV